MAIAFDDREKEFRSRLAGVNPELVSLHDEFQHQKAKYIARQVAIVGIPKCELMPLRQTIWDARFGNRSRKVG